MNAAEFNARFSVGTPVFAYPGARPEGDRSGERLVTRTRSAAEVLGGHTAVVWVDGHSACIALTHIDVIGATDSSPEASAARNVPRNPNELCRDFQPQPEPAEFWCANCRWNKPMHDDEARRAAIAEALKCLPAEAITDRAEAVRILGALPMPVAAEQPDTSPTPDPNTQETL